MYIYPKRRKVKKDDCPFCNPQNTCPYCDSPLDPWRASQCSLNKPLMMVIPPEGVHLDCPVHPGGHHVFGSSITWMEAPKWTSNSQPIIEFDSSYRPVEYDSTKRVVELDSTRPWCTGRNF